MRKGILTLFLILVVSVFTSAAWAEAPEQTLATDAQITQEAQPAAETLDGDESVCSASSSQDATVEATSDPSARGEICGGTFCSFGTYCCNASCNLCVPFGWSCTQESCN